MKYIKKMIDEVNDEIHSAKEYAEKYVEYKSKNDLSTASKFKAMANDELNHGMTIHQLLTEEIDRLRKVYANPPQEMMDKWEEAHKRYVEKVAWIKQMLTM